MKLLLDQGLPRSTVSHLATQGIAAEHVGELGVATTPDEMILAAARQRQAVVVTLDAEFHQLLAVTRNVAFGRADSDGRTQRRSISYHPGPSNPVGKGGT